MKTEKNKKIAALMMALALVAALAACAASAPKQEPGTLTAGGPELLSNVTPLVADASAAELLIGTERAKELVLAHLNDPEAVVTDCDLDDGIYEIEAVSNGMEYDYKVDAFSGEILRAKLDEDALRGNAQTPETTPAAEPPETEAHTTPATEPAKPTLIGADKAQDLVWTHLNDSGAVITSCDLDDGVYEIEVISGDYEYDYDVHGYTGEILKVRKDKYVGKTEAKTLIEADAAKEAVLEALNSADAKITDCELDDGVYEIEARVGRTEYDCRVDAYTGEILRMVKD